ncbi:MAG TPA: serine hydrolase domain-containing protein [Thermoanaerobaculia bacterium]|nr:serine hydrolase domain-containing protein [Thermoanaerobaculia bacterium]
MAGTLEKIPRTRRAIEQGIRDRLHLGAQIYVSLGGEVQADGALGENRPGEPLTPDHLMLWLSSTKPVTAVALATLWERGRLDLDDPVAAHIPEFGVHGKEGITLRHLLTHTAGIRMLDVGWPDHSWEEILARICGMRPEPRWAPGEKAGYHTMSSWFVLGEVIQRLDGRPFDRFVREEVFEPLELHDSWVGMPQGRYIFYKSAGRLGALWNTEGSEIKDHGWDSEARCVRPNPGGNGYGPVRELGRFYEMLLARGTSHGNRILSPQTVEAMTARHRTGMVDLTFKHLLDWGLGFIVNSVRYGAETVPYGYGHHASPRTFGHSGYRSSVGFADPERRLAVALAFNGTPSNERHEARVRSALDAIYEDLGLAI